MTPKSDAQKQINIERFLATLKGFAKGAIHTPLSYISTFDKSASEGDKEASAILANMFNLPISALRAYGTSRESTGEIVNDWNQFENVPNYKHPGKAWRKFQLATRLPLALHSAYKGYKESSPFNKKEDKQLKEVFGDKSSKSSDGSYIPNLPNIESDAIPSKGAFSSAGYQAIPGSESLKEFFNKLKESGYEVPALANLGTSRKALPKGAAGAYSPNASIDWEDKGKALFFRDEDPSTDIMTHELTHYLDNVASSEVKGYLSEMIQKGGVEATRMDENFLKRMFPEEEGYRGKVGEYSRDIKEVLARITGEEGIWDMEDRLIGQTRKSVEDITDTPSGLLGTPQTKGVHKDITEIIKDIESYHKASQQAQNLWQTLPFEAQLKSDALSKILSGKEDLSEADKQSLQYIETGLPFLKEKGYLWR